MSSLLGVLINLQQRYEKNKKTRPVGGINLSHFLPCLWELVHITNVLHNGKGAEESISDRAVGDTDW